MKIDMPVHTVLELEKLLKFMALAHKEMGENNEFRTLFYDTYESGIHITDPLEFESIDKSIFELSDKIRADLKFV